MKSQKKLQNYYLEDKTYHFLNRKQNGGDKNNHFGGATNDPAENVENYKEILHFLEMLEFEQEQIEIVQKIIAAILLIGEIIFVKTGENGSEVQNPELAAKGD